MISSSNNDSGGVISRVFYCVGSFEVQVNGTLVHSKLSTLAYPDYNDLSRILRDVKEGKLLTSSCKQQPITDCCIS